MERRALGTGKEKANAGDRERVGKCWGQGKRGEREKLKAEMLKGEGARAVSGNARSEVGQRRLCRAAGEWRKA
jgi:hypothetical protein